MLKLFFSAITIVIFVSCEIRDGQRNIVVTPLSACIDGKVTFKTYGNGKQLGLAIKDNTFGDEDMILEVIGLEPISRYVWKLSNHKDTIYSDGFGKITLRKKDLMMFERDFIDINEERKDTIFQILGNGPCLSIYYKPNEIRHWRDLQSIRLALDGHYKMTENIVFPDSDGDGVSEYNFSPIGTDTEPFIGTIEGNGYNIKGLSIDRKNEHYIGLIGYADSIAKINNIDIASSNISGNNFVGGVVGFNKGEVKARFSGAVQGNEFVGGITGVNEGEIVGYSNEVFVSGTQNVGGITGVNRKNILGYAKGSVTGERINVGGIAGLNSEGNIRAYSETTSKGESYVGGLVGVNNGYLLGYNTGEVTASLEIAGGLVAHNLKEVRGFNIGKVNSKNVVAGFIGKNVSEDPIFGYTRGVIERTEGTLTNVNTTIAENISTYNHTIYYSYTESKIEPNFVTSPSGEPISILNIVSSNYHLYFKDLPFGSGLGEWSWFKDSHWPTINFGNISIWDTAFFGDFIEIQQPVN